MTAAAPAPQPTPAPAPAPNGATDWRAALGEMGNAPAFSIFKGEDLVPMPRAVAKTFLEAQALVGADKIAKPQDSWNEQQWAEFYGAVGRPQTPKDYKLSEFKLPEGVTLDEGFRDKMLEVAHRKGLRNDQIDGLFSTFMEMQAADFTAFQAQEKQATETWDQEQRARLGGAYDATKDLASRALTAAGAAPGSEMLAKLEGLAFADGTPLLRHPAFLDVFGALGKKLSEGNLLPGEKTAGSYGRTPEQLDAEIVAFRTKHGQAMVREDPTGRELMKQYDALLTEKARLGGIQPT